MSHCLTQPAHGIVRRRPSAQVGPFVLWTCRIAVAATWVYNGLFLKVLDSGGRHAAIVAGGTGLSRELAQLVTAGLGLIECGVAVVVMAGWKPWRAAAVQSGLVIGMNLAGAAGAPGLVGDVADLAVRNVAFLALVLAVAYLGDRVHAESQ